MSTTNRQSFLCARSANARMSPSSIRGLEGVSTNNMRVRGLICLSQSARSLRSAKSVSTPKRFRYLLNSIVVLPKMLRELTM